MATSTMQELITQGRKEGRMKGRMEGKTEALRNAVLNVLRKRFTKVPKRIEIAIQKMNDPIALESLNVHAATCRTLDEFVTDLR
jgi:predicted transposase YdaD